MSALIEFDHVCKYYQMGDTLVKAADHISMQINKGEFEMCIRDRIIVDSAKMSGMVVFLVGVSNILGWVMAFLQIPDAVAAALLSLTSNKYVILLIMNVILLVSGTFMDVTPAILIFTPLFLPICQSFGMSTVQFGLILVYNLCIGNITPPEMCIRDSL